MQLKAEDGGKMLTFVAVVNMNANEFSFSINPLESPMDDIDKHVETKVLLSDTDSDPPAMFVDEELCVAAILVTFRGWPLQTSFGPAKSSNEANPNNPPPSPPVFTAFVFDLRTGAFLMEWKVHKGLNDPLTVKHAGSSREQLQ
ncbi:hypothetical protein FRB98_005912 [Tulasnella sp. 332]|nr:hypothetical protein FRB98_005912 [Tulasnella sp. 332]